jgi:uncharacterized protein YndB with AHSA1/START domain
MSNNRFVYVTYIRAPQQKVWDAITKPEFTRQYWFGMHLDSGWEKGAPWKMVGQSGNVTDSGEVLEVEKPRRLVLKWRNEFRPELTAEGFSRCTIEIEPSGDLVRVSILHEIENGPKFIEAVSGGWPKIMSNLKSLLETGKPLDISREFPKVA